MFAGMLTRLKALFKRKKPEAPKAARTLRATAPSSARRVGSVRPQVDATNELLNPLNPMGLTGPLSPLWHGTSDRTGNGGASSICQDGGSASSYDSGSGSSSCDSGCSASD